MWKRSLTKVEETKPSRKTWLYIKKTGVAFLENIFATLCHSIAKRLFFAVTWILI